MLYSILPARAVSDPRITSRPHLLLALAALCLHTSPLGICYPTQKRLAAIVGRSQSWASKYLKELERMGYVRRLRSLSQRTHHAIRRQVIYIPGEAIPPKEIPEFANYWGYPFTDGRRSTERFNP
jgi:hypothetical protein